MVTILKDFTSKVTKKRYYKGSETNDFKSEYEKELEKKGFVEKKVIRKTKVKKQNLKTK